MIYQKKLTEVDRTLTKARDLFQDSVEELDLGGPIPKDLAPELAEFLTAGRLASARIRTAIDRYRAFCVAAKWKGFVS